MVSPALRPFAHIAERDFGVRIARCGENSSTESSEVEQDI